MKAVIVNRDMEPITIVKLSQTMLFFLRENRNLVLQCMDSPMALFDPADAPIAMLVARQVRLWPLVKELTILQTNDEVDALTLDAAFLAGQQSAVNTVYEQGRMRGFGQGLRAWGEIASQIRRGLQQKGEDD